MLTLANALNSLGVTDNTLSEEEKSFLDKNGYLPFECLMTEEEMIAFRNRLAELSKEEGSDAGKEVHKEEGTMRLSNLINKDPIFEKCINHPRVLAAVGHVLGNFKLSSLNSRAALPGEGRQALHIDYDDKVKFKAGDYRVCNSIWLLDDFTVENGATRIVPGTHLSRNSPKKDLDDTMVDHPNQIQFLAKAGTVVVLNSHTWHSGMTNKTDVPRRAMHSYFCRVDQEQQLNQKKYINKATLDRLSPESKVILDVV
ncbi:MAG: phytanoyl-CoA dioxygenase [Planctomycetota bacterium]|nr:MAG: phytanoyl-CoA dioxygenase [Planctomycetota bacterium]